MAWSRRSGRLASREISRGHDMINRHCLLAALLAAITFCAVSAHAAEKPSATAAQQSTQPAREFAWSDVGRTPFRAARFDPRLLYTLFVPRDYDEYGDKEY